MTRVMGLVLALSVVLGGTPAFADHVGTLPSNTEIVVRDYTSDKYNGTVAAAYAAWYKILPDQTTTFRVVDMGHTDCSDLEGGRGIDGVWGKIPDNEIWVCSRRNVDGATGMTWTAGGGGIITKSYIEVENRADNRQHLMSHEAGHSLNLGHTRKRGSVMRSGESKPALPGDVDAQLLVELYA